MENLQCPKCGSDSLRSDEQAAIGYPIVVTLDDGERKHEYTGESYQVFDEGGVFADDIWCRSCSWNGSMADLTDPDTDV